MRAIRAAYGCLLLFAPGIALRCIGAGRARGAGAMVIRVLGVRHVAQAALAADGSLAGVGVDTLHALSMGTLAACAPGARRPAAASAAVSVALAADGFRRHVR